MPRPPGLTPGTAAGTVVRRTVSTAAGSVAHDAGPAEVYCARVLVEDPDLVARLRAGDQAAFATVVRGWSPAMLRVARAHVRTDATAEEIVQEAWMGVMRALPGFEGRAMLRTWVFRILVNVARRRGRIEARTTWSSRAPPSTPTGSADEDDPYPGHWRDDAAPTAWEPEPALLAAEFRDVLATALAQLPERQRAVVELRDVHGLDPTEVCELLELTLGNQRVLLHRGRARLREALAEASVTPRDIACNELVELLTEYLEGTLPPAEVAAIEEHLSGCDGCRTYLDQLRTTIDAARLGCRSPRCPTALSTRCSPRSAARPARTR